MEDNFRALRRAALPLARIYYAVKANPAPAILERLVGLSSFFDAASFEEVELCLDAGARPEAISFGNTIKKVSAIRAAHERGIALFAFELNRRTGETGEACARCRGLLSLASGKQRRRLAFCRDKFGTTVENAESPDVAGRENGTGPVRSVVSCVGSQQTTTCAYEIAIAKVAMLFTDLH